MLILAHPRFPNESRGLVPNTVPGTDASPLTREDNTVAIAPWDDIPDVPPLVEIDEAVTAALDEVDPPEHMPDGRWRVTDEGSADWAVRKLARARETAANTRAQANRQRKAIQEAVAPYLQQLDEWEAERIDALDRDAGHWEALLAEYHRQVLTEDERAKTVKLPHGKLVARKQPDAWEAEDTVVIDWATKVGAHEILTTKTLLQRAEMKKTLSVATTGEVVWGGELVPGVRVIPGEVKYSVDTEGDK